MYSILRMIIAKVVMKMRENRVIENRVLFLLTAGFDKRLVISYIMGWITRAR